jgi:hypothetical protein
MRRPILLSTVATIALLAGSTAAGAATSFAGKWTAQYTKATTLVLSLKANGANYTGTYSVITTYGANKNKQTTKQASQSLTAKSVVVQKVPTLIVTISAPKQPKAAVTKAPSKITFFCELTKAQKLNCQSSVTNKTVLFSRSK